LRSPRVLAGTHAVLHAGAATMPEFEGGELAARSVLVSLT
jgi:hypothetical protein